MIENLKVLLGITDNSKDDLLSILIEMAEADFETISQSNRLDNNTVMHMVMFLYARLGTEGLNSESYNGATFSYAQDYPDYILKQIKGMKRVRLI